MLVSKDFKFDAAHYLTDYKPPKEGKKLLKKGSTCERLHGHTYRLRVTVKGEIKKNGLVLDFLVLKNIVNEKVILKFDHNLINDILKNPTAENMAVWIWKQLAAEVKKHGVELFKVELWETESSKVEYGGIGV